MSNGYGRIRIGSLLDGSRRLVLVHRLAYELAVAPIPADHDIDHVRDRGCTRRDCCNPAHLEAVSHAENNRRANSHRDYSR